MTTLRPPVGGSAGKDASADGNAPAARRPARTRRESIDYLRAMLAELGGIARDEKLDMLAYLIGMASHEASDQFAREVSPRREGKAPP